MVRYEVLILTVPEITQDETKSLETQLSGVITKGNGALISFERWGKYALAYPVKKNSYGVYFLARFETENSGSAALIEAIRHLCAVKFDGLVMRSMVSVLDPKKPLTYHRQHSLEEATTHDVMVGNADDRDDMYDNRSKERSFSGAGYQRATHNER
jgi:small subunit ribosomal protein S6